MSDLTYVICWGVCVVSDLSPVPARQQPGRHRCFLAWCATLMLFSLVQDTDASQLGLRLCCMCVCVCCASLMIQLMNGFGSIAWKCFPPPCTPALKPCLRATQAALCSSATIVISPRCRRRFFVFVKYAFQRAHRNNSKSTQNSCHANPS